MGPLRTRDYKRVTRACENCRRKKTRCPGERPRCSHCTRLSQTCRYGDGSDDADESLGGPSQRLEARLAQLEERLDLMQSVPQHDALGVETPQSVMSPLLDSSLIPSEDILVAAIEVFHACAHRQPLWLFGPTTPPRITSSEVLLLPILAISLQYDEARFSQTDLRSPREYNSAAQSLIMLKIANGSVDFETLQALCLLSFSNFVCNETRLATFHTSLLQTLSQSCGLGRQTSNDRSPIAEDQRRLFWSMHLLDSMCGMQHMIPSIIDDIDQPRFLIQGCRSEHSSTLCPLLPLESYNDHEEKSIGIWAHMVRFGHVWGDVRDYISKCMEGEIKTPWKPESAYTVINARLLDMECTFPDFYRYDAARFLERTDAEIRGKRHYWLPWANLQITYHTLHCLLNHPFIYSSRVLRPRAGHNAFWKNSLELAILHSTWVARMLDAARKKGLTLADPSLAYAAAVAATLHCYSTRATDIRLRNSAEKSLEICRVFVQEMGARWPLCKALADLLEEFLNLPHRSFQPPEARPAYIAANTRLVWKILTFAMPAQSNSGTGVFARSLQHAFAQQKCDNSAGIVLEDPEIENMPATIDAEDVRYERYASPPDWFSPSGSHPHNEAQEQDNATVDLQQTSPLVIDNGFAPWGDLQTWHWPTIDMNVMYGLTTGANWVEGDL